MRVEFDDTGSRATSRSCDARRVRILDHLPVRTRGTVSEMLVDAYRLHRDGRDDDARSRLLRAWTFGMDALSSEQDARFALMLFRRLRFATDDADAWDARPDPLTIYRAGQQPGLSWTADREVAVSLAVDLGDAPIRSWTIAKVDALAFITGYGEAEVIVDPSGPTDAT